ncbi:MAG: hypothetical protein QM628_12900 [Propionicimonas sp.]
MENLMRIRGRSAWALIVLAGLNLVHQASQLAWGVFEAVKVYSVGSDDGVATVSINWGLGWSISWVFGWQGVDYALMLALVAVVVGCWASPVVPRVRGITLVAAWMATLTVALPWAAVVLSLLVSPSTALGSIDPWEWGMSVGLLHPLIASGVGVVAVIALRALARRPPDQDEDDPDAAAESAHPVELERAEDEHPTVWKPAGATGTVWRTADEAASGAPGVRSVEAGRTSSEGGADAPRRDTAPSDDWRPPASS